MNETPIPPRELDVSVHPGLSAVVTKALAKTPDDRYQTALDVAHDLLNYKSFGTSCDATLVLDSATLEACTTAGPGSAEQRRAASAPVGRGRAARDWRAVRTRIIARVQTAVATLRRFPGPPLRKREVGIAALLLATTVFAGAWYRYKANASAAGAEVLPPAVRAALPAPVLGPTPAAAERGELRLITSPAGATVQIDGRPHPGWTTPITIARLHSGSHTVTLQKPGHVSEIRVVDVESGKRTVLALDLPPRER